MNKYFRPEVLKRKAYTLKSYPKAIKLNQNELPMDFPPGMKRELFDRLKKTPLQQYPTTQPQRLRKRLASVLGVKPDQLLFSNGSNTLIQTLILASAVKGKVMSLEPGFSLFNSEATLLGNRYVSVKLKAPDFEFPVKEFLAKLGQTRPNIIFIANPHAPTGTLFSKGDLRQVLKAAKCPVVIDEAYFQFCGETMLPDLKKFPNLIVLRTFSKGFGMGGVRVGYLVSRKELVAQVEKVLLPYCLPVLSEETALVALNHRGHFKKVIAGVVGERERVFQAIKKLPGLEVYSSKTNFLLFKVKNAKRCFDFLLKQGVLIRNMSGHSGLEGCMRVTLGKPAENKAFLGALKAYVS